MPLDDLGARLLNLLQEDSTPTLSELARILDSNTSTIQRRIEIYRATGVITRTVSVVNPNAVERKVWALALIQLRTDRPGASERLKDQIRSTPAIMSGFALAGPADFGLLVSTPTLPEYENFALSFQGENTDVRSVDSRVILDRVKTSFALPIEAAP
jgi:Lrp/AsnC family transcriptional regulator, leucine-responsive regulatory protein